MPCSLNKLILIIDDSADNRSLLKMLLEAYGYQAHCASNGEEALCLLRELSILPDLILLDVQMPIMDGFQFRIEQQLRPRLRSIPVLVMTGDGDRELNLKLINPQGILKKPFGVTTVIESVSKYLNSNSLSSFDPDLRSAQLH